MLAKLKARLKELSGELDVILAKGAEMTADDLTALDAKTKDIEGVEGQIKTLEVAEAARARQAAPADAPVHTDTLPASVDTQKFSASEKVGFLAVAVATAKLDGGGSSAKAVFKTMDDHGYGFLAKEFDNARTKALNAGSAAAGGIFVPDEISNEVIGLLRPLSTFIQGGPRRVPFSNGNYHMPAAASGSTAYWRGEARPIPPSQPTFKDINMSAKLLGALVPMSDQVLRWSRIDIKDWVERDMAESMATELDRAAYFGTGTVYEPLGITKIPGIGAVAATGGATPTVAQLESNASALELRMMLTNLPMNRLAWVMNPRSFMYLQNLRDANGNRYFPELQAAAPIWRNKPVFVTTAMPINLGGGTNESLVALVNFGDVFMGESRGLTFATSTDASYVKNGVTVSAFQNELTLIRATTEVDVAVKYLEAVQTLTGVTWGA